MDAVDAADAAAAPTLASGSLNLTHEELGIRVRGAAANVLHEGFKEDYSANIKRL